MLFKLTDFIYPPLCLHCEMPIERKKLFCQGCAGFFELIDPHSRCKYCFSEENVSSKHLVCHECVHQRRFAVKMGSALDYLGPVTTLVKSMKYGRMPYLAKTASAFMLAQFERLEWPEPHLIIPVPSRNLFQGVNHAQLIAQELAKNLQVKCTRLLKRHMGDYSQARLSKKQRETLPSTHFYLKEGTILDDQIILIIDDVITTGTTIRRCAEALSDGFPAKIFALSLASTSY